MQDDDLRTLYRNTAGELPDERLDRALLQKAHAVAWRRRHRAPILAAGTCLLLAMGLWATSTPSGAIDTAQYAMTAGRAQLYATNAMTDTTPGMNVHPATNDQQSGEQ